MKDLVQWLNSSREWETGLILLKNYSENTSLINLLQGATPIPAYSEMLFKELRSVYYSLKQTGNSKPLPEVAQPVPNFPSGAVPISPKVPVTTVDSSQDNNSDNIPSELAAQCKLEADKLYKQMMNTRAELFAQCHTTAQHAENSDEAVSARSGLAMAIMDLQYKVDEAYDTYRFVLKHGHLPETERVEFVVPSDPMELLQTKLNLQKSINKLRLKEKTAARLNLIQQKTEHLNQVLHGIDQHKSR